MNMNAKTIVITPAAAVTTIRRLSHRIGNYSATRWVAGCADQQARLGLLAAKCGDRRSARFLGNAQALRGAASNARRQWR